MKQRRRLSAATPLISSSSSSSLLLGKLTTLSQLILILSFTLVLQGCLCDQEQEQEQEQEQQHLQLRTNKLMLNLKAEQPSSNSKNGGNNLDDNNNSELDNSITTAPPDFGGGVGSGSESGRRKSLPGGGSSSGRSGANRRNFQKNKEDALIVANKHIERRLDKLEFELRKSVHLMRANLVAAPSTSYAGSGSPDSTDGSQIQMSQGEQAEGGLKLQQQQQQQQAPLNGDILKWANLVSRLELMEKFIAVAASKLFETERRVKELEKCDCRLSCKWTLRPSSQSSVSESMELPEQFNESTITTTTTTYFTTKTANSNATKVITKLDGQTWQDENCNICSCHRGNVSCKHLTCPKPSCPDFRHVPGECCPVCYKSCVYKSQTVKHGNKLVINSNKNSCKECMCMDGRLRCQRVESSQARGGSRTAADEEQSRLSRRSSDLEIDSSAPAPAPADNHGELELPEEELADDAWGQERERAREREPKDNQREQAADNRRRKVRAQRRAEALQPPAPLLVCPQIDCKLEDQLELKNDCCSYCKGFDFCKAKSRATCHPSAFCINTLIFPTLSPSFTKSNNNNHTNLDRSPQFSQEQSTTTNNKQDLVGIEDMFSCRCRPGFRGDGLRHCEDIDECQEGIAKCDSRTTNCVNLPGSYECRCKPGFRPELEEDTQQQQQRQQQNSSSANFMLAPDGEFIGSSWSSSLSSNAAKSTKCIDVNECADPSLNRCHPEARCLNKRGSYKCQCRAGFLGNGLECHKWFAPEISIAAYLHRHRTTSSTSKSNENSFSKADDQLDKRRPAGVKPTSLPLLPLDEDPRTTSATSSLANSQEDDDDDEDYEEDNFDDTPIYSSTSTTSTTNKPPELSESKWEPLKFDWTFGFQQNPTSDQIMTTLPPDTNQTHEAGNEIRSPNEINQQDQQQQRESGAPPEVSQQIGKEDTSTSATANKQQDDEQARQQLQSLSLNTRTMFFQEPPEKPVDVTRGDGSSNRPRNFEASTRNESVVDAKDERNGRDDSDEDEEDGETNGSDITASSTTATTTTINADHTIDSVYIQSTPSEASSSSSSSNEVDQQDKSSSNKQTTAIEPTSSSSSSSNNLSNNQSNANNNNNNNNNTQTPSGHKRGLIIASATISPTNKKGQAYSSQYYRNRYPPGNGGGNSTNNYQIHQSITILISILSGIICNYLIAQTSRRITTNCIL